MRSIEPASSIHELGLMGVIRTLCKAVCCGGCCCLLCHREKSVVHHIAKDIRHLREQIEDVAGDLVDDVQDELRAQGVVLARSLHSIAHLRRDGQKDAKVPTHFRCGLRVTVVEARGLKGSGVPATCSPYFFITAVVDHGHGTDEKSEQLFVEHRPLRTEKRKAKRSRQRLAPQPAQPPLSPTKMAELRLGVAQAQARWREREESSSGSQEAAAPVLHQPVSAQPGLADASSADESAGVAHGASNHGFEARWDQDTEEFTGRSNARCCCRRCPRRPNLMRHASQKLGHYVPSLSRYTVYEESDGERLHWDLMVPALPRIRVQCFDASDALEEEQCIGECWVDLPIEGSGMGLASDWRWPSDPADAPHWFPLHGPDEAPRGEVALIFTWATEATLTNDQHWARVTRTAVPRQPSHPSFLLSFGVALLVGTAGLLLIASFAASMSPDDTKNWATTSLMTLAVKILLVDPSKVAFEACFLQWAESSPLTRHAIEETIRQKTAAANKRTRARARKP